MPRSRRAVRAIAGAAGGLAGTFAMSRVRALREVDDRTTAILSQAAAERLLRSPLGTPELNRLIPVVRYSYGTAAGAAYGVITPDSCTVCTGAVWGAVLWVISDCVVLPAIASSPPRDAAGVTALSLISHLVYGVATALVARGVRGAASVRRRKGGGTWQ